MKKRSKKRGTREREGRMQTFDMFWVTYVNRAPNIRIRIKIKVAHFK